MRDRRTGGHGELSRRRLLATAGVVAGGATVGFAGFGAPAHAAPRRWTANTTQNGWPVVTGAKLAGHAVEGSNAVVALRSGATATVLLHVVRRFHYEIDALGSGDVRGHTTERRVAAPYESNYLSGTAIAVRPAGYPAGSAGNLFPHELVVVRDILLDCEGVVRWGGDDKAFPKEGHFQIDVPPSSPRLARVAAKIQGWRDRRGQGAGAPADPFEATRRAAARTLERQQRTG